MKNKQGFTLIELVVVMIILGILSVTAAPRFLNLQSDARKSTLEATKGALESAFQIFSDLFR
ncbi:putative membrane protein [Vibrio vulnificus]|nr:putative membrane protein [Vibrio vulnificus]OQK64985.1 putative membrane protein [Vibrio vulnificus]